MTLDRRDFLRTVAAVAGGAALATTAEAQEEPAAPAAPTDWAAVRSMFRLAPGTIDMSAMLIASHPQPVRDAIMRYRDALDANPVRFLDENDGPLTQAVLEAAAGYLGTTPGAVALTDSTTQSVGLAYNGLSFEPGQEILTTAKDYYVTHESLRLVAARSGATVRKIELYEDIEEVTPAALASAVLDAITPATRVVALTWVHSSTGLKLPVATIAAGLAEVNAVREPGTEILLGVDGVHGFGIEDVTLAELGCDLFMAGCHKWLFGPRGTGIIVGTARGWQASRPTVPSFIDNGFFDAWLRQREPDVTIGGASMTPGGFKAFEHRWALAEAFWLHTTIGKPRVMARTYELATRLKLGLRALDHVTLVTPMSPALSSGIVSFDVAGYSAPGAVEALRERGIVASAAPYATQHVRLTPSIRNTVAEIDAVLNAVAELG